jgi:hypothetical protein
VKKEEQIGIRISVATRTFLKKRAAATGAKEAAIARQAMEAYKDISDELGDEWWDIVRRASASEQTPGSVIGRIVRVALEQERKPKK